MIEMLKKEDCCGCNACGDICPNGAILFRRDVGEFLYPEVDKAKCIDCGLCDKVCPIKHSDELRAENTKARPEPCAAVSTNMQLRFESTSGGMFSIFAEKIFKEGGLVGGAVWDGDWFVHQIVSDKSDDLPRMRCSKYSQSDARGFYSAVKAAVESGRKVMVCGTPCQMAAVRTFLGTDYDNLIIVDFICRTTPSPLAFRSYLAKLQKEQGAKVVAVQMKNKEMGWRSITTKFAFDNDRLYYDFGWQSEFMKGYAEKDWFSRPSCYACKFRGFPRIADISIGDCWGAVDRLPSEFNDNVGTSIVLCNTEKGSRFFSDFAASGQMKSLHLTEDDLKPPMNPGLYRSPDLPSFDLDAMYREMAEHGFDAGMDVAKKGGQPTAKQEGFLLRFRHFLGRWRRLVMKLLSFRGNVVTAIKINGLRRVCSGAPIVIPIGNVVWEKDSTAKIEVSGDLRFGKSLFKHSSLETRMLMMPGSELQVAGGQFFYGSNVELFTGGKLEIGHHFHANINCTINCGDSIKIGNYVSLGRDVSIRDTHGHIVGTPDFKMSDPVEIGDHAWIASGAMIMPGVKIGAGAIVGARSLVLHDVPPNSLVVGSPARVVRKNVQFKM